MKAIAQTLSELAAAYKVNPKTLTRWIKRHPEIKLFPRQKIFTPQQLKIIYEKIGEP